MVLVSKSGDIKQRITSKWKLLCTTLLGISLLIIPIIFVYVDPILFVAEYKLRLENGSMLHDLLLTRFEGPKIYLRLFNVTNAEEFMSGRDKKVKVKEIGPFVYQEYRINDDLEINQQPGIMRYTPKLQAVFLPEESICNPEDIYLTTPNIPLLSAVTLLSKYPYFIRQIFNYLVTSIHAKPFVKLRVYDYLWGYPDPLLKLANTAVPGLIYFKSVGLMERFYDQDNDYRLELGTKNSDKFSVKNVHKFHKNKTDNVGDLFENTQFFNNTYEGAAFPPDMTPETPINIYRHSICHIFRTEYRGHRSMFYGGDAFVYNIHNSTFQDHQLCDTKGWCPDGLKNLAPCFFGLPFAISKGHFFESDPRLLEQVDGLKPDQNIHDSEIIVDPKIGVTIAGSVSVQVSLFLSDVGFNPETRRLTDIVLPVSHAIIKVPRLLDEAKSALRLMYTEGPYILLTAQVLSIFLALGLLSHSARMVYWNWIERRRSIVLDSGLEKSLSKAHLPLLFK